MGGYAFHSEAVRDLDEIWEYIAEDNIDAADRVLADFHSTLATLAASPQIGHRRSDLTMRPLRFQVVRDEYLIAYAPAENPTEIPLWILAVFHGRLVKELPDDRLGHRRIGRRASSGDALPTSSAAPSGSLRLSAGRNPERLHGDALVTHVENLKFLRAARRPQHHVVAGTGFHQRARQW